MVLFNFSHSLPLSGIVAFPLHRHLSVEWHSVCLTRSAAAKELGEHYFQDAPHRPKCLSLLPGARGSRSVTIHEAAQNQKRGQSGATLDHSLEGRCELPMSPLRSNLRKVCQKKSVNKEVVYFS